MVLTSLISAIQIKSTSAAETIVVPNDYSNIQAAINAADPGDTIYVRANTYYEHVIVNKTVSLIGENKYTTIIDGSGTGTVVKVNVNNVTISNFEIRYSGSNYIETDSGIWLEEVNFCSITDNILLDNNHRGINLWEAYHNVVSGNTVIGGEYSIALTYSDNNLVSGNTIENCEYGIILSQSDSNLLHSNTVTGTDSGSIILQYGSDDNTVSGNSISDSYGVTIGSSNNNLFSGNTMQNNMWGIRVYNSFYCHIIYNNFVNSMQGEVTVDESIDIWDNGYPYGGNYWSNYTGVDNYSGPDQNQPGSDGIGDTPYIIDENNQDNYPLMSPITPPIPALVSVNCPGSIVVGEWATITVTARNDGEIADEMYVSVSLPDNPPIDNIQIISHNLQDAYILSVGDEVWGEYGNTYPIVLEYPLVEGFRENWENGETKTLQFKVKPQNPGIFRFFVKTTAQVNGLWSYDPHYGTKDQQNEYVYVHGMVVSSPWDDEDGDNRENFMDLDWDLESLMDYGMPESRIYVEQVEYGTWWKFELAARMYLIAPETAEEVVILTNWVKEHTASQDYNYITSELLDYYILCFIAFETDKDVLTVLPMIGTLFDFLPGDSTYNWVRIITPLAFPDPLPILQIASSPGALLSQLIYAFPCITDGDEYISYLTGKELLFRFTRPMELSLENILDFGFDVLTLSIGQFLSGALPLKEFARFAAELVIDFLSRLAWKWIKDLGQAVSEGYNNFLATLLEDPEGDVDMALFVDGEFVLGSYQNITISNSTYGEYLGDFPTELMITYTNQITNSNPRIVITAQDVVQPENVSLQWMSFKEGDLVANGTFKELIPNEAFSKEYEVTIENGTPSVIPEFPSFLVLPLFMIATLLAVIIYRRKHSK